jgi:cytochrome P450
MTILTVTTYPPGPTNHRQTLLDIQKDSLDFLCRIARTYGDLVHYCHGPGHVYLVSSPDLIQDVLVEQSDMISRTPIVRGSMGRFLGDGLLMSSGMLHRQQRQVMQPLFASAQLASYASLMIDCTEALLAEWHDGETRDIFQDMLRLGMDIIYRTLLGSGPDKHLANVQAAITLLQKYTGQMLKRTPQIPEADCQRAIAQLDEAAATLIDQRRTGAGVDLVTLLIDTTLPDTGQPMPDRQIRDEVVTFLAAGQETTASALAWTWYLLGQHPEAREQLQAEFQDKLGNRRATAGDLPALNLSTRILRESMRLYPPAWLLGRTPIAPITLGGYTIRPGDSIAISPYVIHRNPDVFPEPERFLPERFATEPPPYTYLPFGAGPHTCIGQSFAMLEMGLVMATIARQYDLELAPGQHIQPEPLITLQPKEGIKVILHRRR